VLYSTKHHHIFVMTSEKSMKKKLNLMRSGILAFLFMGLLIAASAQNDQDSISDIDLFNEISHMDSLLFDAFNTRDIHQFERLFTKDLEFYHDKGGLTNYDQTIDFMKTTAKTNNQLRRDLVKGSMEVYPIPGYGAMEIAAHTFCHLEDGKENCGTFRVVHLWKKENGEWKISRVVSYGH